MTILNFENQQEEPLLLVLEPWGDEHVVPHLATAGVRLVPEDGAQQRYTCCVGERRIALWCEGASYEIDIVRPSRFDLLLWDICVRGGWCGGIVDGAPSFVTDLLPDTGMVTARGFAELAIRADGLPESESLPETQIRWLEEAFARFFDPAGVPAATLRRNLALPFGGGSPHPKR